MHLNGALIDFPVWLQILVVVITGELAVDQFDAADFDNSVAL
jgi:hypothetical protein